MAYELGKMRTDQGLFLDKGNQVFDPRHPDFEGGAKGDGSTDDTAAIQAALDAQIASQTAFQATNNSLSGSFLGSVTPVIFPAGHYIISDELTCSAYARIIAEPGAIIEQTDPTKRILVFSGGFTCFVAHLKTIGGTKQVDFQNDNIDGSILRLLDCEFQLSNDYAIYTYGTADGDTHLSANISIERCKFIHPRKILHNVADSCRLVDCWASVSNTNFDEDSAAILNLSGELYLDGLFGVPTMGTGASRLATVRWIDNYDSVTSRNSRFGGEDAGMPIIYHQAAAEDSPTAPYIGTRIDIQGGWCYTGPTGATDKAAIYLVSSVPHNIRIEGVRGLDGGAYIAVDAGLDLDDYFDAFPASKQTIFKFTFGANTERPASGVPSQLLPYVNWVHFARTTSAIPTDGWWDAGQSMINSAPSLGEHARFHAVTGGEPGTWGYEGKVSPWPIGAQAATDVTGSKAKITLSIPSGVASFTIRVTMSTNPNSAGSVSYRTTRTDLFTMVTGFGTVVQDELYTASILAPAATTGTAPSLDSYHFGTGDTGDTTRAHDDAGSLTIVYGNCSTGTTFVSVDVDHLAG